MNIFCRLGILAACLLAPSIAAADDSGWYLGFGLGQSRLSAPPTLFSQDAGFRSGADVFYSSDSSNQESTAKRLEGGYWFNPNFGLQVSYMDLGESSRFARGSFQIQCQTCYATYHFIESARVKARGVALSVTPRLRLTDSVDLIGRLGIFRNRTIYSEDNNGVLFLPDSHTFEGPGLAVTGGVSLGWDFKGHWEALLGVDEFTGIGDSKYGTFSVTVISLGIQYHF
jgi:hypothetical protein